MVRSCASSLSFSHSGPSFFLSTSLYPARPCPSDVGQYAIDEQRHDGGTEQAGHGYRDEPGQEDVPEQPPVHRLLGADPAYRHHRAHLMPGRERENTVKRAAQKRG